MNTLVGTSLEEAMSAGQVEYWRVASYLDIPKITHHRATYYENTSWQDHPWATMGRSGADFVKDWAIEVEYNGAWQSTGRGDDAWVRRCVVNDELVFASHALALNYTIARMVRTLADLEEKKARIQRALEDYE